MNPLFRIDFSISDSLKIVRKSVLIYETIIVGVVDIQSEEYKLGQNIRKYRLAKGWSQMDLSNAVDIDRTDISKYENGSKGEMGFKTLKKIANALNVTVDQLLGNEDEFPEINSTYNLLTDTNKAFVDKMVSTLLIAICAEQRPLVRLPAATRRSTTATFIKGFR